MKFIIRENQYNRILKLAKFSGDILIEQDLKNFMMSRSEPARSDNTRVAGIQTAHDRYVSDYNAAVQKEEDRINSTYSCVPKLFRYPVNILKMQNSNGYFLKAALGVIGRESDFGSSDRFTYLNPLKTLWAHLGGETSVGYAQIKPETARNLGYTVDNLNSATGALKAAASIIIDNYEAAKSIGYTNNPSNVVGGTGNAKLDMAIMGYNLGKSKIVKYCETNDPKLKRPCSDAGKVVDGLTVTNKYVPDYIPNYKSERWDGVSISTHGYIQEVAKRIKGYTCFQ